MATISQTFEHYIRSVASKFAREETSEMGYRTSFETLLGEIFGEMDVKDIGHDDKTKGGNKPDFVIRKNNVPIVYIEAKDIGVSLDKVEKSEQMARYFGYANLILTDYVEFRFYRNGEAYGKPVIIAEYNAKNRTITPNPENYEYLARTFLDFTQSHKEPIKSGKHLAKIMGGKAQRIRDNIREILSSENGKSTELLNVYDTIKRLLVNDLTIESFADMYAQTLVYGLFVARFHDNSPDTFTRQEARDLIPASNPFLGSFFDHIAGRNFEKRLSYIVDELCEVFSHADVEALMQEYFQPNLFGDEQKGPDPVIHFYEDFLKEYDDVLRKKMGAYYTPLPVVQFIVRSVDYLLEKEFKLQDGLASTTKTKDNIHKVQILDPAVGTGTFVSDVIDKIHKRVIKGGQDGRWPGYVHYNLLPRLHGFELMMAPYTIAHLKLSLTLKETGFHTFYDTKKGKARLGVYLTNSLEEVSQQPDLLAFDFGASIAEEAKEASKIKNEKPIMVVVGNPPYSVSSSNKGEWITNLTKVYKENLNERNIQPLSDDYIKFIRLAEHFIEKNGIGTVAMITNNSFLDGIIHRQMRKHLLETFDDIYILDLHGHSKKKEITPDRGKDENVFDIQQGVSINMFVRKVEEKKDLGKVYHADLYGKRADKFAQLNKSGLNSIEWQELDYSEPYYFFVPKDFRLEKGYGEGLKVDELFGLNSVGIVTSRDSFLISENIETLKDRLDDILDITLDDSDFSKKYDLRTKYFNPSKARLISRGKKDARIIKCFYRPFDFKYLLFDPAFIERDRQKVMRHMIIGQNVALVCSKQSTRDNIDNIQVVDSVIELKFNSHDRNSNIFPLYLYHEDGTKTPNLKPEVVDKIEMVVGKTTPEDVFDYIYAVLHSSSYREKYKEFLKIDFPRVPYPKDKTTFKNLVKLGTELRQLHLLESPKVARFITTYPVAGSNIVEKITYKDGNVYINVEQYFGNVPDIAWNFYIGGYQPAQKWLKDRKGRQLTNEDIEHYQRIIVALVETDRRMKEVDKIWKLH